jgi:hypothetical protein
MVLLSTSFGDFEPKQPIRFIIEDLRVFRLMEIWMDFRWIYWKLFRFSWKVGFDFREIGKRLEGFFFWFMKIFDAARLKL